MISASLIRKISEVEPHLRDILISILEEIERHTQQIAQQVTKEEFNELKEIVAELARKVNELAEAQKRTEQRLNELAEAQRKSEERIIKLERAVTELAEAQKKTEQRLNELAEAQKKLTQSLERTNRQLGGLSRSVAYALENEAYRKLPEVLKSRYSIEVEDRFIRTYIGGEEISVFAKAKRNGKEIHLIGEAVLRLDDRSKLRLVMDKANIVREELGGEVVPIIVTHFARPDILERANRAGVIVIQSFEW